MTTPPRLLADRVGNGPIIIQRTDTTKYSESDPAVIQALIATNSVEGVGPRSGSIRFLRMLTDEATAQNHVSARLREVAVSDTGKSGWLAPTEVFEQQLGEGLSCFTHRLNARLIGERFNSCAFNPELSRAAIRHARLTPPVRRSSSVPDVRVFTSSPPVRSVRAISGGLCGAY